MLKCEGNCVAHNDSVISVDVFSCEGTDWGTFNYCTDAILRDVGRGFSVVPVKCDDAIALREVIGIWAELKRDEADNFERCLREIEERISKGD